MRGVFLRPPIPITSAQASGKIASRKSRKMVTRKGRKRAKRPSRMSWSQHRPRHDRYVRTDRAFLFWTTPQGPHADWTSSARGAQSIVRDQRCPNYRARAKVVVGREPWSVAPQLPPGLFSLCAGTKECRKFELFLRQLEGFGITVLSRRDDGRIEDFERALRYIPEFMWSIFLWEMRWPGWLARDRGAHLISDIVLDRLRRAEAMSIDEYRQAIQRRQALHRSWSFCRPDFRHNRPFWL
jgi:hypothetical protein